MVGQMVQQNWRCFVRNSLFYSPVISIGFLLQPNLPLAAETDRTNNVEEEEGYFIMDYFMHDFRFHFISDYILFKPLISLMGQPDIVVEMAKPYLDIVAFVSLLFFQAYKQFADGESDTKSSMWATIIGNVINVIVIIS
jgi:MATE family multidrug resistance protein